MKPLLVGSLILLLCTSTLTIPPPQPLHPSSPITVTSVVLYPQHPHDSSLLKYPLTFTKISQMLVLGIKNMQWMGSVLQDRPKGWKAKIERQMDRTEVVVSMVESRWLWRLEFSVLGVDRDRNLVIVSEEMVWEKGCKCEQSNCDIFLDNPIQIRDLSGIRNIISFPQIQPLILLSGLALSPEQTQKNKNMFNLDLQVASYTSKKLKLRSIPKGVRAFHYTVIFYRVDFLLEESISIKINRGDIQNNGININSQQKRYFYPLMVQFSMININSADLSSDRNIQKLSSELRSGKIAQYSSHLQQITHHLSVQFTYFSCQYFWSLPHSTCQPTCLNSLPLSSTSICLDSQRILQPGKGCPTGCNTCNANACTSCLSGFVLSAGACIAMNCMPVCTMCTNTTDCTACVNNLVISGTICDCSAGTFLDSGTLTCITCTAFDANCLNCGYNPAYDPASPTPIVCLTPAIGFFVQTNGTTAACGANCQVCTSATVCTTCAATYSVSSGACVSMCATLITGCDTCVASPSTLCTLCTPGYYPASAYPSASCSLCPARCATCTSGTVCLTCISPFTVISNLCLCSTPTYLDSAQTSCVTCSTAIANCLTCTSTSPTTCSSCSTGYSPSTDSLSCTLCPTNCQVCSSTTVCTTCITNYTWNGTHCQCVPCQNCLALTGGACTVCTSASDCQACADGYYLSGVSCLACLSGCLTCNNGTACTGCALPFILGATNLCVCDNAAGYFLTLNNSTCQLCSTIFTSCTTCSATPQTTCTACTSGMYFNSATNLCTSCLSLCLTCPNATFCTTCANLTFWDGSACSANCSALSQCLTCSLSPTTVLCTSCNSGYTVNAGVCVEFCGDGVIIGSQTCDDSNAVSGDGCSSSCQKQAGFFCLTGAPSLCYPCMQYCIACVDNTTCTTCNSFTSWDTATNSCFSNCSAIALCATCTTITSTSGDYLQCLSCTGGYSVQAASNTCKPVCGDGIVAPEEGCDDGNLDSGDGCGSSCLVETYFTCSVSATTSKSVCILSELTLEVTQINKKPGKNSGQLKIKPFPDVPALFRNTNWASVIQVPNNNIAITNIFYDSSTDRIVVDFDYTSTVDPAAVQVNFDSQNNTDLSAVSPFVASAPVLSTNNVALVYYQDSDYSIANAVKYLSIAVGVISVLFIIAGLFAGRLIALECSAVIQLTFMCLLTLQDLSPSVQNLIFLSYSLGFNRIKTYDLEQNIDRPYKSTQLNIQLVYNYNIMMVLVAIPAIVGAVFLVMAVRAKKKQVKKKYIRWGKWAIGEYTLYMFLSFSYLAYASFYIQAKYFAGSGEDAIGIVLGVIILVLAGIFVLLYVRRVSKDYFLQFKDKFRCEITFGRLFYLFIMIQRLLSPAFLVTLSSKHIAAVPILIIFVFMAVLVMLTKPYKERIKNYRPLANYAITILVLGIYIGIGASNNPESAISRYGPLVIVLFLLVCIAYSVYAWVQDLRQKCSVEDDEDDEEEEKKMLGTEMDDISKNKILMSHNNSLVNQSPLLSHRKVETTAESHRQMNDNSDTNRVKPALQKKIRQQLKAMHIKQQKPQQDKNGQAMDKNEERGRVGQWQKGDKHLLQESEVLGEQIETAVEKAQQQS